MESDDWADIFAWVSTDPEGAHRAFLARDKYLSSPAQPSPTVDRAAGRARPDQPVAADRHDRAAPGAADGRRPRILHLPGSGAVRRRAVGPRGARAPWASARPIPQRKTPANEPTQLLILINISAVFMGTALAIRDLVGERAIFRREQAVGLSASAYLGAKIVVFTGRPPFRPRSSRRSSSSAKADPPKARSCSGNSSIELYLTLAGTAIVSAIAGLALSSLARSPEQILPDDGVW